tara:strand:- start:12276 stop:13250 length:975 start_codon:yes stop_codon:yes gene_type:complete
MKKLIINKNNKNISYWNIFSSNFSNIIHNNENYNSIAKFIVKSNNNMLLYGINGFPIELFIDEIVKKKYNLKYLYKSECYWNKTIIYLQNQYFFEIDLLNPTIPKDFSFLKELILHIVNFKNISNYKHLIILKHIDVLKDYFSIFKILLENYSHNAFFICTTNKISCIEQPIISRFTCVRIPLFSHPDIISIFNEYFDKPLNKFLIEEKTRNIIFCIFIADIENKEPHLITKEFCTFNYPPLYDFIKKYNKKSYNIDSIRSISYKCFQYNIKISKILCDILKITNNKNKMKLTEIAANLDYILSLTNKGREPIYIESLLCQLLL